MKLSTIAHHSTPHIGERDSRGLTHPCNGFADCFIADAVNFCFTPDAVNFFGILVRLIAEAGCFMVGDIVAHCLQQRVGGKLVLASADLLKIHPEQIRSLKTKYLVNCHTPINSCLAYSNYFHCHDLMM